MGGRDGHGYQEVLYFLRHEDGVGDLKWRRGKGEVPFNQSGVERAAGLVAVRIERVVADRDGIAMEDCANRLRRRLGVVFGESRFAPNPAGFADV